MDMKVLDHSKQYFTVDGHLVAASFQSKGSPETFQHVRRILLGNAEIPQIRQGSAPTGNMEVCTLTTSESQSFVPPKQRKEQMI